MDGKAGVHFPLLWEVGTAELPILWVNQKLGLLSPPSVLWFIFSTIVLPPLEPLITPWTSWPQWADILSAGKWEIR